MTRRSNMPPIAELEAKYGHLRDNPGFRTAREKTALMLGVNPDEASLTDGTDEGKILAAIEVEDDTAFVENLKKRIRETNPELPPQAEDKENSA